MRVVAYVDANAHGPSLTLPPPNVPGLYQELGEKQVLVVPIAAGVASGTTWR